MKNRLNIAAIPLLIFATGCGSLASHWRGGSGVYQGVRFDCEQVAHHSTESEVIAVADIPLSAVVDTLFLPYDLAKEDKEKPERSVADAAPAADARASSARVGYK